MVKHFAKKYGNKVGLHPSSDRDVASGADRHLDITFGLQEVESSSLVSVLLREAFNHPYISFFHLLVNSFSFTCIYIFRTDT